MASDLMLNLHTAALDIIQALADGNRDSAVLTVARCDGQQDKLVLSIASIAALMLNQHTRAGRTPADTLEGYRAYLLVEES